VDVGVFALVELDYILVLVGDVFKALAFVDFDLIDHVALLFIVSDLDVLDLLLNLHVHVATWRTSGASTTR